MHNDGEDPESFLRRQQRWAQQYHNSIPLTVAAKQWPTPISSDVCGVREDDGRRGVGLNTRAENWPTPNTTDAKSAGRHTTSTGIMHAGTSLTDAIRSNGHGRRLNPQFVEWLMGLPIGWTAGLPRIDRLRALGNAVVPAQARAAIRELMEALQ